MTQSYIYVSISILLWGTIATISKIFFPGLDPYYILFYSFLFATLTLILYNGKNLKAQAREAAPKDIIKMCLIGSLGVFFYNYFLQRGMAILPGQIAFVINYMWPALVIIFSTFILKEKLTLGKLCAVLFSFMGVAVVTTNGSIDSLTGGNITGMIFCLMAAICYSLYTPLNKKATYNKDFALTIAYGSGTLLALIIICINGTIAIIPSPWECLGLALYGIGTCAVAYIFWVKSMEIGNTALLSNLAYMTPIVSLVLTHLFIGEEITVFSIAGLSLIIIGIILQSIVQKKKSPD